MLLDDAVNPAGDGGEVFAESHDFDDTAYGADEYQLSPISLSLMTEIAWKQWFAYLELAPASQLSAFRVGR